MTIKNIFVDGSIEWHEDGKLHRDDGPAYEGADGTKEWYWQGKLHRLNGPAVKRPDGSNEWYRYGKLHREFGPAVEDADGNKMWCLNGEIHRKDGPAVEFADGSTMWFRYGKLHREDGPAIEGPGKMRIAVNPGSFCLEALMPSGLVIVMENQRIVEIYGEPLDRAIREREEKKKAEKKISMWD